MKSLRRLLTAHSCTVVCTLSQPSIDILEHVDNYLFLVDGITVFNGSLHQLSDMVGVLNQAPCEVTHEVVYKFMDLLSGDKELRVSVVREWYERKAIAMLLLKQTSSSQHPAEVVDKNATEPLSRERRHSIFHQIYVLAVRHFLHQFRAANGVFTAFVLHIFAGIVIGVIYYKNIKHLEDLQFLASPTTLVFDSYTLNVIGWHMACPVMVILARAIPIPVMFYTREIYDREQVPHM